MRIVLSSTYTTHADWFHDLTNEQQEEYLDEHPGSKYVETYRANPKGVKKRAELPPTIRRSAKRALHDVFKIPVEAKKSPASIVKHVGKDGVQSIGKYLKHKGFKLSNHLDVAPALMVVMLANPVFALGVLALSGAAMYGIQKGREVKEGYDKNRSQLTDTYKKMSGLPERDAQEELDNGSSKSQKKRGKSGDSQSDGEALYQLALKRAKSMTDEEARELQGVLEGGE